MFCKDDILQKKPISLRNLLIVATPYVHIPLQVVAEYRLFYRAFLQKRPIILRSLLIVATPYVHIPLQAVAEYSLFYRAFLQKRHIILRSLLIVATTYMDVPLRVLADTLPYLYVCTYAPTCECIRFAYLYVYTHICLFTHTCVRIHSSVSRCRYTSILEYSYDVCM